VVDGGATSLCKVIGRLDPSQGKSALYDLAFLRAGEINRPGV
jgi:hypothetical protein